MISIISEITTEDSVNQAVVIACNSDDDLPTSNIGNGSVAFVMSSSGTTTKMFDKENSAWRDL